MIDRERLLRTFLELVAIDSPSGAEDSLARDLKLRLLTLGGQVEQDGHGNVVARWPQDSGEWLLLSAHMDTNGRDVGIRPQVRDGVVYSDGSTILGADDKSGISVILEVLHSVASGSLVAPPLEVVFTVEEETGLVGARRLDKGSLRSRRGYVVDGDGHAQRLEIGTPTKDGVTATVRGRRSHASKAPEAGIDAIRVAAQAIASMPLGRLDRCTTANIGRIEGGSAPNMVADEVCLSGEARSHDLALLTAQVNTMISCLENAARRHAASVEISITRAEIGYALSVDTPVVALAMATAQRSGITLLLDGNCTATDANVFNAHGISCAVICTGVEGKHTHKEHLVIDEMVTAAQLLADIIAGS